MNIAVFLDWLSEKLNKGAEYLLITLGGSMAFVLVLQVFFRYALNHSLFWSEELGRLFLVWLTFVGASVAYRRGAHIGIEFFVERLGPRLRRCVRVAVLLISLVLFVTMVVYGVRFGMMLKMQSTTTLGVSRLVPFAAVPLCGVLMSVHALAFLAAELRGERS